MNDVELLRQSAKKMRLSAEMAECRPGRWAVDVAGPIASMDWLGPSHDVLTATWRQASHVAAFAAPAVTLAVADWLDESAGHLEEHIPAWTAPSRGVDDPPALAWNNPERLAALVEHHYGRALAVARAYLGVGL